MLNRSHSFSVAVILMYKWNLECHEKQPSVLKLFAVLWKEEINLKNFLHPLVIRILAENHDSMTIALDGNFIKQLIVKCDLSKSVKTAYIWFCSCWKLKMFQKCVVEQSVTLNKTLSILLGIEIKSIANDVWGDYLACHELLFYNGFTQLHWSFVRAGKEVIS